MLKYPGMNCSFVLSGSLLIGFPLSIRKKKKILLLAPEAFAIDSVEF